MIIDLTKLAKQNWILDVWEEKGRKGTAECATGFGKTFLGILGSHRVLKENPNATIRICVPTDYLRNKWKKDIEEHKIKNAVVNTINSWVKQDSIDCDLLILDEIHGYTGGEVFNTVFDRFNYKYILGLTAKERNKEEDRALLNHYCPIIARVPMSECLANGWVSPFIIYNLGLDLPPVSRKRYNDMHSQFVKYFSTFDFDLKRMYRVMADPLYLKRYAKHYSWSEDMVKVHAFQANRIMQKRKDFLYTHDVIFDASKRIIEMFPEDKIITFSEVTSFADRLEEAIPESVVYHSSIPTQVRDTEGNLIARSRKVKVKGKKNPLTRYFDADKKPYTWKELQKKYSSKKLERVSGDRIKEEALLAFESDKSRIIHTARALNEGVDIHGITRSIKNSFNSTTIDSLQRTGRAVRIDDSNPDKRATEINLYIRGTQSFKWLKSSQKESPKDVIKWVESFEELT